MVANPSSPSPSPPRASSRVDGVRAWFLTTAAGRILLAGAGIKLLTGPLTAAGLGSGSRLGVLDVAGTVLLGVAAAILAWRLYRAAARRMLWRVRRKLTLSYIFIGVVPVLLVVVFFALCGLFLVFSVSSYLTQRSMRALEERAAFLARTAAVELAQVPDTERGAVLERRWQAEGGAAGGLSYVALPVAGWCTGERAEAARTSAGTAVTAGRWTHLAPPDALPAWLTCTGFRGLVAFTVPGATVGAARRTGLAARAVALPVGEGPGAPVAVIVDVPVDEGVATALRLDTSIELGEVSALAGNGDDAQPEAGRAVPERLPQGVGAGTDGVTARLQQPLGWVTFLDFTDWSSGRTGSVSVAIGMSVIGLYERISATPIAPVGDLSFGQVLLLLLVVVGSLFLVIQLVAFLMGFSLARSITGSVHALFEGTERVRRGDLRHKIDIGTDDQLGELAESFNTMTASIENLLQQKAEKERLEQELLIARRIQMSLLPQEPPTLARMELLALCEPAREVGGDYYDFIVLDEHRLGVLVADVAGKGTSAALYMAELKGLVLSLAQHHESPRALLIEANRLIAQHLESASFITATYGVLDARQRTFTYARAGHCPLLHLSSVSGTPQVQVLAPGGLVVGLKLDGGEMFARLLEESCLTLAAGDLVMLYTDGVSEAMNEEGDCFGETRLVSILEAHGALGPDAVRQRVVDEIRLFSGSAPQHDDMTLLLVAVS